MTFPNTLSEFQLAVGTLHGKRWDGTPELGRLLRLKLAEEAIELFSAMQYEQRDEEAHEIGDVLFVVLACARYLGHDAQAELTKAIARNRERWDGVGST